MSIRLGFNIPPAADYTSWALMRIYRVGTPDSQANPVCLYGKIFQPGGMAERLKAHVLKTCLGHTNVGSNPTPSAHVFQ